MPTPQPINIHANKIYDIAANAVVEGEEVTLTNLNFEPDTSPVGTQEPDENPEDNNVALNTNGAEVGATAELLMTADGSDGKKYEALAVPTVVAEDVPASEMTLTWTVREAA